VRAKSPKMVNIDEPEMIITFIHNKVREIKKENEIIDNLDNKDDILELMLVKREECSVLQYQVFIHLRI